MAGALARFEGPLGTTATDGVRQKFDLLYFAQVFGQSCRILVSVLGITIVGLSVTGVLVGMRKRSARLLGAASRRRRVAAMPGGVSAEWSSRIDDRKVLPLAGR